MTLESLARTDTLADQVAIEVKTALIRMGQNQAALARALGEPQMWVSDRLRGKVQLTLNDLARMADVLGLKIVDLLPASQKTPTRSYAPIGPGTVPHPDHPVLAGAVTIGPRGPRRTAPTGL